MKHMQQPMLLSSLIPTSFDLTSRCPRDTQGVPHGATQLSGSDHEVIFVLTDAYSTNFTSNIFGLNFEVLESEIVLLKTRFWQFWWYFEYNNGILWLQSFNFYAKLFILAKKFNLRPAVPLILTPLEKSQISSLTNKQTIFFKSLTSKSFLPL